MYLNCDEVKYIAMDNILLFVIYFLLHSIDNTSVVQYW